MSYIISSSTCGRESLEISGKNFFVGWLSFLSPNQQCHSTEEDSKIHPFFIQRWTPDRRGFVSFVPALQWQYLYNLLLMFIVDLHLVAKSRQ